MVRTQGSSHALEGVPDDVAVVSCSKYRYVNRQAGPKKVDRLLFSEFPMHAAVTALYDLSTRCIEGNVKIDRAVRYPVPKRDIEETKREVENDVGEAAAQLRSVLLFHSRLKRPPPDDDDDGDEASVLR
jgi:hypothetical protein